jgi:DNA helicase-2/ATP-dependent DNA helicase PcrA
VTGSDGTNVQTIYAWRLADVRRILSFPDAYPRAQRVQLATNYRCPADVVIASRRLIEWNAERFAKRIEPAAAASRAAAIAGYDTAVEGWEDALVAMAGGEAASDRSTCFLARTRAELMPVFAALVRAGIPHRSPFPPAVEMGPVQALLAEARKLPAHLPAFEALRRTRVALGWLRVDGPETLGEDEHAALDALLGWSVGFHRLDRFLEAHDVAAQRLAELRRDEALVELVTVHAAKGREWQTVVILGAEEDRFPNRRSLVDAREPERALEEERRLAYVALTRATQRLILAYDRARPSRFLAEAGLLPPRPSDG